MSGICGQFNLDNAPASPADLRAMTSMLAKRGPDATNEWLSGAVGLGHTLLITTPELQFERQPFTHADTGCVITADVRLDNRDELLRAFNLCDRHDVVGDAELILRAYLEWGDDCPIRLMGDFAFAVCDPRSQTLFCARDHFGLRPFYYHHVPGERFLCASDARAILVLPQVPYRINEGRIADFLVPQLEWIDYTSTFYEDINRLPPGHKVTVTPSGMRVAEYWRPEPGPELGAQCDDDFAQGFLEVFTQAVESRLRAPEGAVGSMLSGGMDSGSVVAVGKDIQKSLGKPPLPTFSAARKDGRGCAETQAIRAAISMPSISPTLIHPDALASSFKQMISGNEEPFDGEFMILKAIYHTAHRQGARVVLDGAGGDVVLNTGTYIQRIIRQGNLGLAVREIIAENRFWGYPSLAADLLKYALATLTPEPVKKVLRPIRADHHVRGYLANSIISKDFATSVRIKERFESMREIFPGSRTADYAAERYKVIRPNLTGGRERYARVAATASIEARDPFLDKRLVDYCMRLPGHLLLRDGWPKRILRDVMADRLPDEVRWCKGKPHLGWLFNSTITNHAVSIGKLDVADLHRDLQGYVDPAALDSAWRLFRAQGSADPIHSAYILANWLRESKKRPTVGCADLAV